MRYPANITGHFPRYNGSLANQLGKLSTVEENITVVQQILSDLVIVEV